LKNGVNEKTLSLRARDYEAKKICLIWEEKEQGGQYLKILDYARAPQASNTRYFITFFYRIDSRAYITCCEVGMIPLTIL